MKLAPFQTWEQVVGVEEGPQLWRCERHEVSYGAGIPDSSRLTFECPACMRELWDAEQALRGAYAAWTHWRTHSGVPHRLRCATPDLIQGANPSAERLQKVVSRYVSDLPARREAGQGMLLLGPPGLGKTLALCTVINAACAFQQGSVYCVWPDVLTDLKAAINAGRKDDPRRDAAWRLREVPFLAIDELGVRGASEFDASELFALVDYRYRNCLPTLVAANATPQTFPDAVGERVADRLREIGPTIVLTGESQRGRIAISGPDAVPEPPATQSIEISVMGVTKTKTITATADWSAG